MRIIFEDGKAPSKELEETMYRAAAVCLAHEHIDGENAEISVSFVSPEQIRELNGTYRGKDSVTDVLSFPQFEDLNDIDDIPEGQTIALGDVVICEERAGEQAEEFGHSLERELIYLFVHSIFHLLGYDHMEQDEKAEMRAAEEAVMQELGITRE